MKFSDALAKHQRNMPVEERLDSFISEHADMSEKYPGTDLFRWHNILTGSCELCTKVFLPCLQRTRRRSLTLISIQIQTKNKHIIQ